jgi:hypothetical protein
MVHARTIQTGSRGVAVTRTMHGWRGAAVTIPPNSTYRPKQTFTLQARVPISALACWSLFTSLLDGVDKIDESPCPEQEERNQIMPCNSSEVEDGRANDVVCKFCMFYAKAAVM